MINPPLLTFSTARSFLVYHREDFFHSLSFNLHRLSRWFSLTKKRRAGRNSCSAFAWGTEEYFRPRCGMVRRLRREVWLAIPCFSRQPRCPRVSKGRAEVPLMRPLAHTPAPEGNDAPTAARVMGLPPRRGIVLSFGAKESTKESMRHGDSGKKPFTAHF